ncbi:hypothetical protein [Streptomyces sp. NPDC058548]|uniref:hypothetical protein n=1 Tax=unclassified Streptomyces TaxID=2593676 RepID=UPI0036646CB2
MADVRELLGSWTRDPLVEGEQDGRGSGLAVPPAAAATVIHGVRTILAGENPGGQEAQEGVHALFARTDRGEETDRFSGHVTGPFAGPSRIAGELVVAEHPSAEEWNDGERRAATAWVAVLIDRLGENGVERLVERLSAAAA